MRCIDHLEFTNGVCPDCGLEVDNYGNTEQQWNDYCSFPDCGCDGARLCGAKFGSSDQADQMNVEGMWQARTKDGKRAIMDLIGFCGNSPATNEE